MTRRRSKAPSQRQLRVGEEIRHALSRILARGGLRDPVLADAAITVSEVRVSPDLKNATAFVIPLAGGAGEPGEAGTESIETTVAALGRAASYLRGQLGQEIELRYTPQLRFEADSSFDEAARVEALLRRPRVQRDLQRPEGDEGEDAPSDAAGFTGHPENDDGADDER